MVRPAWIMTSMSATELPSAAITIGDLYRELVTIRTDMASMLTETKVIATRAESVTADITDHEGRIRRLEASFPPALASRLASVERWQLRAGAVVSFIALVVGLLSGWISAAILHVH